MAERKTNKKRFHTKEVKRGNLSEQVADQLQHLIIIGDLENGDKLPPERELTDMFRVSRTVIREATRTLQERGFVKILTGSGTYVTSVDPSIISQSLERYLRGSHHAYRDLLEVRKNLEVQIAELAAARASDDHIIQLEQALHEMEACHPYIAEDENKHEAFVQADVGFHLTLADSTGNALWPVLLAPIADLVAKFSRETSKLPNSSNSAIRYHRELLEAVKAGDSKRGRQVMHEHMRVAEAMIKELPDDSANISED
jgi:GntR family transcriptional regulator, transcriptional repressor for pyruvate dehydrogenase complex